MEAMDPKLQKYYRDVSFEARRSLENFREKYPYQEMEINDFVWRYLDMGEGEQDLLILAGGAMIAEISFNSIGFFAQHHRVIAPDYPAIETLDGLFSGLIEMLDRLGVEQCTLMGGSYGGWIAQSLVRAYPERVKKVVISAVGPPNPENSQQLKKIIPLLRFLPMPVFRGMINRSFSRLISDRSSSDEIRLLWALIKEVVYTRVSRADFVAAMQRLIDQTENYSFGPDDLVEWPGEMLLLFGSEDPASPPEKRQAMQELYPQAQVKIFEGGEHGIAISHKEEYFATIEGFIQDI